MASGFDRVYEIAPIFRAEVHDTTKYLNEATSVDADKRDVFRTTVVR